MTSPISSKLKADYVELVNQYLDKIPVNKNEDFEKLADVLEQFFENREIPDCGGNSDLKGRLTSLKEMIDEPEMYAKEEHCFAFKTIVLDRVAAKVFEIKNLTSEEKEKQIKEQANQKEVQVQNHEIMSRAVEPEVGSEAHTISHEQQLAELQEQFLRERNNDVPILEDLPIDVQELLRRHRNNDVPTIPQQQSEVGAGEDLPISYEEFLRRLRNNDL